jgi:hypothetical protein
MDIHDEQEGSASGWPGEGRPGRPYHQRARALHMTVRQFQRVKKRFREHGARGQHRSRPRKAAVGQGPDPSLFRWLRGPAII